MRIVSLNAWGGTLFEELAAWLPTCGADVLCLQETTRTAGLSGWTTFADSARSVPQRADLFDDVRALLPSHVALFDASDAGPVLDGDRRRHRQEFGLAMLVDESHQVLGRQTRFVHGEFTEHDDEWPADGRPRIAQGVRLADPGGRTVAVVHVHGLRIGSGKQDTPDRIAQARRLAELVDEVADAADLTVVCGDLNVLPTSRTFEVLAAHGLTELVGTADTRTSRYPKPVRHASYLFVSDPAAVRSFEVMAQPEVSDHRALVLDV